MTSSSERSATATGPDTGGDVVTTSTARIWRDERGIVHASFEQGTREDTATTREALEAVKKLTGSQKARVLLDIRRSSGINREGRQLWASRRSAEVLARCAILVRAGLSRAIGNFFIDLQTHSIGFRLFTSENDALRSLNEDGTR